MKTFKMLTLAFIATSLTLNTFATSLPTTVEPVANTTVTTQKKLSYHEMKAIAETQLGKKLNFKQKVVLRLANGKLNKSFSKSAAAGKSQLIALVLAIVIGGLGVHRFYLGYTWQGIVQILTLGGFFGIWVLIDIVRIAMGTLKPKDGDYEKTL